MNSVGEALQRFDRRMQPIRDAIDAAVRAGEDLEAIWEDVDRSLQWWRDELAARESTEAGS